jgi:putative transcriptional regulator
MTSRGDAPTLDELLAAHAAGSLPAPVSLIVGTHLALSPASRRRYALYEAAGGVLLDRIEPAPMAPDAWARICARLDGAGRDGPPGRRGHPKRPAPPPPDPALRRIPRPLRDYLPPSLDALPWRHLTDAATAELAVPAPPGYSATLINVRAGRPFPRHSHEGTELILVIDGGFRDESGHYVRGDLQIAGPDVEHQPVADEGRDWLWLRVLDAPLRPSPAPGGPGPTDRP